MLQYLAFAAFIAFILYMARPQRPDKVYHSEEEVREEVRQYKENSNINKED